MSRGRRSRPVLLCLGAGERAAHIEMFRRRFTVITVDSGLLAAAAMASDGVRVTPEFDSPEFGPALEAIVRQCGAKVILPMSPGALRAIECVRRVAGKTGAKLLAPEPDVIATARDRALAFCFFISNSIPTPTLFTPDSEIPFPVMVKPSDTLAADVEFRAENSADLEFFCRYLPEPVIQQMVEGDDYEIEVMSDFDGHVLSVVPLRVTVARGGELACAVTTKDPVLIDTAVRVVSSLGSKGPISLRAVRAGHQVYFTEISCGFGSGATLCRKAGADPSRMLAAMLAGKQLEYDETWTDGLMMSRGLRDYYVDPDDSAAPDRLALASTKA